MKTKNFLLPIIGLFSCWATAQQDSEYTNYMYNSNSFNPAYIGSTEYLKATLVHRNQWVGLDGAPVTNNFSIYSPVGKSVTLGLSAWSDKIGPSIESSLAVDFSYTIKTSQDYKLAFGLKVSGALLNVDYTKLDIYQPDDQEFARNIIDKFIPNIGVGLFYYNTNSYIGLSTPGILTVNHIDETASFSSEQTHIYLTGGYVFEMGNVKLKPALLAKYVKGAPIIGDFSANFLYLDRFTLGAAYRTAKTFSALTGVQVTNQWFIGYAYDSEIGKLSNYNGGSHEIILRFDLGLPKQKLLLTPRFF